MSIDGMYGYGFKEGYSQAINDLNTALLKINNGKIPLDKTHRVEIGSFDSVVIKKMFGPTIYCSLRITPKGADAIWLIEREVIKVTDEGGEVTWETICEFDAQESIEFREG